MMLLVDIIKRNDWCFPIFLYPSLLFFLLVEYKIASGVARIILHCKLVDYDVNEIIYPGLLYSFRIYIFFNTLQINSIPVNGVIYLYQL